MITKKSQILLILILILPMSLSSCSGRSDYVKAEGMIWNTLFHVTYKGPETLRDSIIPVLNEVGKSLSVFDGSSLVSKLNVSLSIEPDSHLSKVYEASGKYHELSRGRFDPTVSPLVDAWGFGIGHQASSDTLAVDSILQFVGLDKTFIKGNKIIKKDIRTRFNFSAIAKGYGVDQVGEMLRRNGVKDFMVEIGGELLLAGRSPSGNHWHIAVDAPVEDGLPGEESVVILSLTDAGIATSGNYRNYRIDNGRKTAHTISPLTGRPFLSEILSATVISSSCMEADALATSCMAGTLSQAVTLLEETSSEGMLILSDTVIYTGGFKKFIKE